MAMNTRSRKIVFCWPDITGYMAACWRALSSRHDIDVFVIAFQSRSENGFSDSLMEGIDCYLLTEKERTSPQRIQELIAEQKPDILYIGGWWHPPYRKMASVTKEWKIKLIMGMDTPWQGGLKQQSARVLLRWYISKFDRVVVTGERSWQYACRLGVPSARVMKGLCGIDFRSWEPILQDRLREQWPRSFLFAGTYNSVKAIDVLLIAYRKYKSMAKNPWKLRCCGRGPLESAINNEIGVENLGFVQPTDMHSIWRNSGAFVLASRSDAWPLVLVEAAATGLPIICTDVCGSSVEIVRNHYNGLTVPTEDPDSLAGAMLAIDDHYDQLPVWGAHSQQLAAPYSAEMWADRWQNLVFNLCANDDPP